MKVRVEKVDGFHIQMLHLTLNFKYLRPIIEKGYLYIACPPLYKILYGKNIKYVYSDKEKDDFVSTLKKQPVIQRFKGLGEMDSDELYDTTMNPENRKLYQITLDDIEQCEEIVKIAMGDEVGPRKEYILNNVNFANNIDI